MRFNIDRIEKSGANLLGPGERVEIWFHGCPFNCLGCITQDRNRSSEALLNLSIGSVFNFIMDSCVEGVTFSGGEPLMQIKPLIELSRMLKKNNYGIILYTGYTKEQIEAMKDSSIILSFVDTLIDGRYVMKLDDNQPFRGSSNQRIINITKRYAEYYSRIEKRESTIMQNGPYLRLTGIPDEQSKSLWKHVKMKGKELWIR